MQEKSPEKPTPPSSPDKPSSSTQPANEQQRTSLKHLKYRDESAGETLDDQQKYLLTMNDFTMKIHRGHWDRYSMGLVFVLLDTVSGVKKLYLDKNQNSQILLQIQEVNFPNLIYLNLQHNKIESIEALSFLNAPSLKTIDFANNCIMSIKPIRKLHCPLLSSIALNINKIKDSYYLTTVLAKSLSTITIEQNSNPTATLQEQQKQIVNVNWYFKLESTCPRILISSQSIKNKKLLCKLKEKILIV